MHKCLLGKHAIHLHLSLPEVLELYSQPKVLSEFLILEAGVTSMD